jgi:hypothetical protein
MAAFLVGKGNEMREKVLARVSQERIAMLHPTCHPSDFSRKSAAHEGQI